MKKLLLILTILLPMIVSAQKTIENPVFATKSLGSSNLGIEKIVLKKDTTKLFMFYNHPSSGIGFAITDESTIFDGNKQLKLISAEGIELNKQWIMPSDKSLVTHFVLNFPAVDKKVDRVDFYEGTCDNCFKIYGIALTDRAAAEIKAKNNTMPANIKNYAENIKDNGEMLDPGDFINDSATIKLNFYGLDMRIFPRMIASEVEVYVEDPFTNDNHQYTFKVNSDKQCVIKVPMLLKHQMVYVTFDRALSKEILISAGKTVEVNLDFGELANANNRGITPYFTGDNADFNYALGLGLFSDLYNVIFEDPESAKKVSSFTASKYYNYLMNICGEYQKRIDTAHVTKRAKELLSMVLRNEIAYYLYMSDYFTDNCYRSVNNKSYDDPIPDYKPIVFDTDFLMFPKALSLDNINMFYVYAFGRAIGGWERCHYLAFNQTSNGKGEIVETVFGNGDSYFKDFIRLQSMCRGFESNIVVHDSLVSEVEQMRNPFYAKYVKKRNAEINAKLVAEKQRGGYFTHKAGDSQGDSLLVELIKDFKGKVVFIDFWNTWCGPCRQALKEMAPMEESYEGKDVVFLFVADESSPENEYNGMIPSMKGHHYRLNEGQKYSLMRKWNFNGIPSYVIIGKDGIVKDYHTGFHGVEYYKQKIDEELNK